MPLHIVELAALNFWQVILSILSTSAIFGCGVLYQKFNALSTKVEILNVFSDKCHAERIQIEGESAQNTAQILTEIKYLRELYSELRQGLRDVVKAAN